MLFFLLVFIWMRKKTTARMYHLSRCGRACVIVCVTEWNKNGYHSIKLSVRMLYCECGWCSSASEPSSTVTKNQYTNRALEAKTEDQYTCIKLCFFCSRLGRNERKPKKQHTNKHVDFRSWSHIRCNVIACARCESNRMKWIEWK